jgi:hypothetical protein
MSTENDKGRPQKDERRAIATSEMPAEHLAMLEAALVDRKRDISSSQPE